MNQGAITTAIVLLLLAATALPVASQETSGFGFSVGQPVGLSIRADPWVAVIGWSVQQYVQGAVDFWVYELPLYGEWNWYIGAGLKGRYYTQEAESNVAGKLGLGFRFPIGARWFFLPRFELFGEMGPGILLFPLTQFEMDIGIGLRLYLE